MPDLEWRATAIAGLLAIVDYISDENPDAAQALEIDLLQNIKKVRIFLIGQKIRGEPR